ncbi:MAG: hypothetical protein KAJ05_01170 [Candidatus Latescibacteria bacterium]|nr:hypothetical protein [Candidatus Latescibacterota bacterium]MCK5327234.1 hypothetical protein [Candidatus Latescibacterota bacterium]MCK5525728.1 hypothetical protein [Candidatus Latescibacterota bacterium]
MSLYDLVVPLGIVTYSLILFGVLTGTRVIKVKLKWHKRTGITILVAATLHAAAILYSKYF